MNTKKSNKGKVGSSTKPKKGNMSFFTLEQSLIKLFSERGLKIKEFNVVKDCKKDVLIWTIEVQ